VRLVERITDVEREAYFERLRVVLERADQLDAQGLEAVKSILRDAQVKLLGELAVIEHGGRTAWDAFITPRVMGALETVAAEVASKYGLALTELMPQAFSVGVDIVNTTIGGSGIVLTPLPQLDATQLGIYANFDAGLVTAVGDEVRQQIGREVALNIMTGEGPDALRRKLAQDLEGKAGPWHSVATRAEVVARTETARVQGLGVQKQMEQVVTQFPELEMKKMLLVAHVGGYPCKVCSKYEGIRYDINDPQAPATPIHPRCRCVWVSVFPGMDDVQDLANVPTEQRRAASVAVETENLEEAGNSAGAKKGWLKRRRAQRKAKLERGRRGMNQYSPKLEDFQISRRPGHVQVKDIDPKTAMVLWGSMGLPAAPTETLRRMLSGTDVGFENATLAAYTSSDGHPGLRLTSELHVSGVHAGDIERFFIPATQTVEHGYFAFERKYRGGLRGSIITFNSYDQWRLSKAKRILIPDAGADNGAYTWAAMGFLAEQTSWNRLRAKLPKKALGLLNDGEISKASHGVIVALCQAPKPQALWLVADAADESGELGSLGKIVLPGESWRGTLEFGNTSSVRRFEEYRKRKLR